VFVIVLVLVVGRQGSVCAFNQEPETRNQVRLEAADDDFACAA
jgi:hypothetical protein